MGFCFWNAAGRFELTASTCAKRVKFRGEAGFLRMAMPFAGCREASSNQRMIRPPGNQFVDKPSLWGQRFFYAGGARGGKARLESDQMSRKALPCKACVERSDYFCAARRHKNNDII